MGMHTPHSENLAPESPIDHIRVFALRLAAAGGNAAAIGRLGVAVVSQFIADARSEIRIRKQDGTLYLLSSKGLPSAYLQESAMSPTEGTTLHRRAVSERVARFVATRHALPRNDQLWLAHAGAQSVAVLPLCIQDTVLGVFTIFLPYSHQWNATEQQHLELIAAVCALALGHSFAAMRQQRMRQQKDDLFTSISHELRTPLTAVYGYLELIERKAKQHAFEPSIVPYVDTALRQARTLADSIDQLIDVSLIEQSQFQLRPMPVRPEALLHDLLIDVRSRFAQRLFEADLLPASQEAVWDGGRVRQIMHHLVKNAVMYSDPPAPIQLHVRYTDHRVVIGVRDYGQGIPPDNHTHIFERFWRGVDNSINKRVYGIGLGLYISKALTTFHGGQLLVESAGIPGQGSTFSVYLPWHAPTA